MSKFYNPQRTRNLYDPSSEKPFKLSRSKIELFMNCARCFYMDRRLGIGQPPGYPFSLNSAVDKLLKKEFDQYRIAGQPHPICIEHGIDAVPFSHEKLEEWRDSLHGGIQFHFKDLNFIISGGVDDLWIDKHGRLIIVDYKATAKNSPVTLDEDWQIGYKRQMSFYAWLFRMNGFQVADTGYFVYCNGLMDRERFDSKLEFKISILPSKIDDSWVERAIRNAHSCLNSSSPPTHDKDCDFCRYLIASSLRATGPVKE